MDELDFGATIKGFIPGQKVFARYTLKKILGRGGMGVVWLARDEELERDVALKFLPELVVMDKEAVKDLKRETRRSLELTHSHIIRIYDFINDARSAAISMEYIAGDTLASLKADRPAGCFEVADIREWTRQLCEALDYAHRRAKVVHRDLKPANLMIDEQGYLKVADFGIAASTSDSISRVSAQTGSSGTPLYMSPQQMLGEKPAVTDDIYSLGATLFELLTGKAPFHSGNVVLQVQSKAPPSLAERRRELEIAGAAIPPEWEATLAACLAKTPEGRPQSAAEVWRRLNLAEATPAAASTTGQADGRSVVRETVAAEKPATTKTKRSQGLVVGALVVLVAGSGYWNYLAGQRAKDTPPVKDTPPAGDSAEVDPGARAQRLHVAGFTAWAGELDSYNIYLTPLKYTPEAFARIAEGVKQGAAHRIATGDYQNWESGNGVPGQPKPADLKEFIKRPRPAGAEIKTSDAPEGYLEAIGWWIAQDSTFPDVEFAEEEWMLFLNGLELRLTGRPLAQLSDEDHMRFDETLEDRRKDYARKARSARAAPFFAFLDTQPKIIRTASGLRYQVNREGKGDYPTATSVIRCRFSIRDVDGEPLGTESTTDAIDLRPGDVMPGMWEGLQHVRVGGEIQLYIPEALTQPGRIKKFPHPDKSLVGDMPQDRALKVEVEVLAVLPP